jgi:hypothetical protein
MKDQLELMTMHDYACTVLLIMAQRTTKPGRIFNLTSHSEQLWPVQVMSDPNYTSHYSWPHMVHVMR